ncbi:uncharacterized protein LOC111874060 isoform X3 [Cryptotermes secundus]|uniref:uncharacterized protein LOC111874060 isoform X3 n=1 Tax=Cryptotermes secundus TaxID=105785 RepID=UPI000CD7D2F4|nr:uncharacterized protein LOC111874060 isoform X3 [Cryptotermes secundus]
MSGNGSSDETEEAISQHLQDLGMLEDGMTTDDKRNLWAVIKISQDTAKAEEQNRQKQARKALQFDQVSSRSESSSGLEAKSDSLIEEIISPSDHKEDNEPEDKKRPTVAAVLPQQRATPLVSVAPCNCTTATVSPLCCCHEDDLSQDQNTVTISLSSVSSCSKSPAVVSKSEQVDSSTQDSQDLPRCVAEPSARRGLRPRPNVGMKKTTKLNPTNNLSGLNSQSLSLSGPSNKERDEPQTVSGGSLKSEECFKNSAMTSSGTCTVTGPSSSSSSPIPVVESSEHSDQDILESSVPNIQESSLVKKVQNSLTVSNYQERIGDKSEANDDCHEESNFSALKERTEEMDVEKCARVSSSVDNVPSPSSDSLSNITLNCNSNREVERKGSEDRERNINPFNCDRSNYERTLKVRKVKRACSRFPFYIPPYKMDIHTYITYFKRSLNEQAARLIEVQRRNPRCVAWGDPVVAESSSRVLVTLGWGEEKGKSLANIQRRNFQNCGASYLRKHTLYAEPDVQSDDDLFFTDTRRRKVIVESQQDDTDDLFDALLQEDKVMDKRDDEEGSALDDGNNSHNSPAVNRQGPVKRKSDSSDDQIFDEDERSGEPQQKRVAPSPWITAKKEEAPPMAVKRKKPHQVLSDADSAAHSCGDLDGEFEPSEKQLQRRGHVKSCMMKKTAKNVSSNQSQSIRKGGGMDGEADTFVDLDNAAGVAGDSNSCPESCQETEIIRPGPVKLRRRGRRLFHQNQVETEEHEETEHNKENAGARMDDVTGSYEVGSSDVLEQEADVVPCPICRKTFLVKDIEAHASECNEYCEEEVPPDELRIFESSSGSEMATQSSQGAITEKCWSEFENKKEFEGDHITIFRTRQPRPQAHQGTAASKHTPASPSNTF